MNSLGGEDARPFAYLPAHPDDETLRYPTSPEYVVAGRPVWCFTSSRQHAEGTLRRRYALRRRLALAACRAGLHFLTWRGECDAYSCACKRILFGAEEIR